MPNLDLNILKIMYGDTPVQKIMQGDTQVFPYKPYDAEVEYLRSSGTQYINTGVKASSNITIRLKCNYPKSGSGYTSYGTILGSRIALTNGDYSILHAYQYNFRFGNKSSNGFANSAERVLIFDSTENAYIMKVYTTSNTLVTTLTVTNNTFSTNYDLYMFALNNAGTIGGTSNTIYSCKIYESSLLVRDFIPVRVVQVGYMYDKVSGQLFGNVGTGDFILGNDVNV